MNKIIVLTIVLLTITFLTGCLGNGGNNPASFAALTADTEKSVASVPETPIAENTTSVPMTLLAESIASVPTANPASTLPLSEEEAWRQKFAAATNLREMCLAYEEKPSFVDGLAEEEKWATETTRDYHAAAATGSIEALEEVAQYAHLGLRGIIRIHIMFLRASAEGDRLIREQ